MKIGKDKIKHFAVNFAVVLALGGPGVWLAAGLSIGKEYGDKNATGTIGAGGICWRMPLASRPDMACVIRLG